MRFDFTRSWSAGAGVRYWYAEAGPGISEFVNFGLKVPLNEYTSLRRVRGRNLSLRDVLTRVFAAVRGSGGNGEETGLRVVAMRLTLDGARSISFDAKAGLAQVVERLICNQ